MLDDEHSRLCETLKQDITKWEGQNLEFMERFPDNVRELAKEIAAFATTNVGTVYIGVECVGLLDAGVVI
jgi:predicted HTH transcriptional regulator